MATVFTMIINGDLPGHFVWRDETAVAFMSINPINDGHTLVVPVAEVDHWTDLPASTNAHMMNLSQRIGKAQQEIFSPLRVGLMIAGFEVPHTHLHVIPLGSMAHLDFANAATEVDHGQLASYAASLSSLL
jgi:diadenosine tetraphosphate (Ap4A) HIT family hydrolase